MGIFRALRDGIQGADALHSDSEGARSALDQYSATAQQDFTRQFREREAMYESERRWPHSRFWMRRQRGELKNVVVDLDPTLNLLRSSDASTLATVELLATKYASRVFESIWANADKSATVAELALDIRRGLSVDDHDIIAGIQVMLATGALNPAR